jgi:PAS domain S-box-containing protein
LDVETLLKMTLILILPLILGPLIWRNRSKKDELENDSRQYRNLTNELNEVASKSEVVINAIGDGVMFIDAQGLIQLINPAAQAIVGWGKQDAITLHYKSVLKLINQKDETLDETNDPISLALNNNQQIKSNDLNLVTNSGKKIAISLLISPVGTIGSGVIVVFRDITKERDEGREQAEFISTASHEMRTPVASIEGYLGLALNSQTAQIDERARQFITKAHESAEHLGHLFQDLLDVSKSEDGRMSNNPKVTNIVIFIRDIVQGLRQKADEKGLRLIYKPMPDDANERFMAPEYLVNLDNDHIREIVNNLVDNAIKYTLKGEVSIDVTGDDEHVIFSVKDSGIGIPNEDIPHLFQKFYRVDNKDTHEIGGTGLGLYLCRKLAEMMGGRIWVESKYGEGSTFNVELPRISRQEAEKLKEQEKIKNQQQIINPNTQTITSANNSNLIQDIAPTEQIHSPNSQPQLNKVPRGDALTPNQIADYVNKQRALAQANQPTQIAQTTLQSPQPSQQNSTPQPSQRPTNLTVPTRNINGVIDR